MDGWKQHIGKLVVDEAACYGCGLCRNACPEECIEMVDRT